MDGDGSSSSNSSDAEEFEAQRRIDQRITYRPRPPSIASRVISSRPSSVDSRISGLLTHQQPLQQPTMFDGTHTPRNIAAISFLLGAGSGMGLAAAWLSSTPQIGLFLLAVGVFHFAHYQSAAIYHVNKLGLEAYLFGNMHHCYEGYHAAAWLEFAIEYYYFPAWKRIGLVNYVGFALVVIGLLCRVAAVISPRQPRNAQGSCLAVNGVYSMMRHPYFFGLYWWTIGVQIMLLNPLCLTAFVLILHNALSRQIRAEEQALEKTYQHSWIIYKANIPTWLPFIP